MKKIVIYSTDEIRRDVAYRLQIRFPECLVTSENQLTRVFSLYKKPELLKQWIYNFATEDVNMLKGDEGFFFLLLCQDEPAQRFLEVFNDVYDVETHWRYFVMSADGNPIKIIANVLNYDLGLPISKVHLPKENYEFIP